MHKEWNYLKHFIDHMKFGENMFNLKLNNRQNNLQKYLNASDCKIHKWQRLFTSTWESFLKIGLSWILQDVTGNAVNTETPLK